jgi:hypothetical protein
LTAFSTLIEGLQKKAPPNEKRKREEVQFKRDVSIIAWWQIGDRILI